MRNIKRPRGHCDGMKDGPKTIMVGKGLERIDAVDPVIRRHTTLSDGKYCQEVARQEGAGAKQRDRY